MQKVPAKSDRHLGDDGHFFYKVLIFLLTIPIKYCKLKQKISGVNLTMIFGFGVIVRFLVKRRQEIR